MKRKIFLVILSLAAALGICLGLAACDDDSNDDPSNRDEHLIF